MRIAVVGDVCVDYYPGPPTRRFVGGNAANVAMHLKRCGGDVALFGVVGDDPEGRWIADVFSRLGVERTGLECLSGTTALTEIAVRNGERGRQAERSTYLQKFSSCGEHWSEILRCAQNDEH